MANAIQQLATKWAEVAEEYPLNQPEQMHLFMALSALARTNSLEDAQLSLRLSAGGRAQPSMDRMIQLLDTIGRAYLGQ